MHSHRQHPSLAFLFQTPGNKPLWTLTGTCLDCRVVPMGKGGIVVDHEDSRGERQQCATHRLSLAPTRRLASCGNGRHNSSLLPGSTQGGKTQTSWRSIGSQPVAPRCGPGPRMPPLKFKKLPICCIAVRGKTRGDRGREAVIIP
jgi:hypothetical protein